MHNAYRINHLANAFESMREGVTRADDRKYKTLDSHVTYYYCKHHDTKTPCNPAAHHKPTNRFENISIHLYVHKCNEKKGTV